MKIPTAKNIDLLVELKKIDDKSKKIIGLTGNRNKS